MATGLRYSVEELRTIRDQISGRRTGTIPDKPLVDRIKTEQPYLMPLVGLAGERELFDKLQRDPRIGRFSFTMFFPVLGGHLDSDLADVEITIRPTRTRGFAARILVEGKDVVIKPIQSPDEPKIAKYAGEQGIGPGQYETLDGFLTEEFLPGKLFSQVSRELDSGSARAIGLRVAEILSILHKANFVFNDVIFDDDFGGSHLIVDTTKGTRLIDFGVSIDLTAFPNLTDEQIYRVLLTLPGIGGLIQAGMMERDELDARIAQMKETLQHESRDGLIVRDIHFVHEGLGITSMKSNIAARAIFDAFEATYHV